MQLLLATCEVRSWLLSDADSLAIHANNRDIWRNLRDAFPHPYRRADAVAFIQRSLAASPPTRFAIAVNGQAVGAIGVELHQDVERIAAEIGYWLSASYWGRGIMTEVVQAVTEYALQAYSLTRLFAVPYEWNPASCRVLEKVGYVREARMRRSAIKDGCVIDQFLYAYVKNDVGAQQSPE